MTIMEMAQDEDKIECLYILTENMETITVPSEDIVFWDFGWNSRPYIRNNRIHLKVNGLTLHIKDRNCEYDEDYTLSPCQRLKQYNDIIEIEVVFKSNCLHKRLVLVTPWLEVGNTGVNQNQTTTLKSYRECIINIDTEGNKREYSILDILDQPVGTVFVPINNDELGEVVVTIGSLYDRTRLDFVRVNKHNMKTMFIKKEV